MKKAVSFIMLLLAFSCSTKSGRTDLATDTLIDTSYVDSASGGDPMAEMADSFGSSELPQQIDLPRLKSIRRDRSPERQPPIVGGETIPINLIPWQVLLEFDGDDICGGSIIADRWIITACHCVSSINDVNQLAIFAGLTNKRQDKLTAQKRQVVQIVRHDGYDRNNPNSAFDNDIALLKLDRALDFGEKVTPIRLATPADERAGITSPDKKVRVSGWGVTTENGTPSNPVRFVDIDVISNTIAASQYNRPLLVTPNMLAAGNPRGGQDACQGDSGGPLAANFNTNNPVLVGVVSYGEGCGRANYAGIYTRVSKYIEWIQQTTNIGIAGGSDRRTIARADQ
ncbi:serine protease [Dyadobacter sp. CY326]|uniref:serine protease n=1 Tax=Dyadobacter sp. CY326 TaxID=2907300 RepID=UPI001F283F27|nr:serine protease [Dyadobacter sp. CY326]MCE7066653.1 serine protease [Dyadobacter sp. CY326]